MIQQPDLFWGLIASMWIGNLMLVVLNLPLVGLWVSLLKVPYRLLFPAIMVFSAIGIYSTNNTSFDVYLTALFGVLGILWRLLGCSPVPMLLGFVLGPMMEENLRRALQVSDGDPIGLFHAADQPRVHHRHGPDPDRDGDAGRAQAAGRHCRLMSMVCGPKERGGAATSVERERASASRNESKETS